MSVIKCTPEERNHIDATGRKVFAPFKGIRMRNAGSQEPGEVKSGIRNADQGVWNLLKNDPESSNWNLKIMKWNPESKTVLHSLTLSDFSVFGPQLGLIKQQKSGFSCFESCKVGNSPQFQFHC